jgi:hypothetical protein
MCSLRTLKVDWLPEIERSRSALITHRDRKFSRTVLIGECVNSYMQLGCTAPGSYFIAL